MATGSTRATASSPGWVVTGAGSTAARGRTDRASSRPSRAGPMRTATGVPTSMVRVPSVIAVQWKATVRSAHFTSPTPRGSSKAMTVPRNVA